MARGKHLFPFRTEPLSPSAPMVLGLKGPGRVGRRRFIVTRTGHLARWPVVRARHQSEPWRKRYGGLRGGRRMATNDDAEKRIDERIRDLGGWRGETLG